MSVSLNKASGKLFKWFEHRHSEEQKQNSLFEIWAELFWSKFVRFVRLGSTKEDNRLESTQMSRSAYDFETKNFFLYNIWMNIISKKSLIEEML